MEDRNPSPPLLSAEEIELIQYDNIGETVFSKKWVLSTLMKLVQSTLTNAEGLEGEEPDEELRQSQREDEDPHELDDTFERELCELWDMSMNTDVAAFLEEMETTDVLLDAILKSQNVRVTEICVGILANMACNHDVSTKMIRNRELIDIVTALLEEPDAPILVEVTRLINVCLSNNEVMLQWMAVLEKETVFKNFIYILENSLNVDLLTNCSQLVDKVLDSSDVMLRKWADLPLVTAVCEAMKQMHMRSEQLHIVETLLHILQMVSTIEQGVQGLVSCVSVIPLLCHFIAECGHDEGGIIVGREVSLTESFSVMNVILVADPITVLTAMEKDPRIMKVLLGLLGYSCKIHRKLSKSRENRLSLSENDERKFERSFSSENSKPESDPESSPLKGQLSKPEHLSSTSSSVKGEEKGESETDRCLPSSNQSELQKDIDESSDQTEEGYPAKDAQAELGAAHQIIITESDVQHQYFQVATGLLKDIISESAKAPKCVFNMLAPHEMLLQKIVHYASRITVYNTLISDLVKATLSIPELSTLHLKLSERLFTQKLQSPSATEG